MLNGTDNPLFCSNSCSLCCIALLTTDGAIFHSKETDDRLLAMRHKIKIQILLEKLTFNHTLLFSVYHVSEAWAMIRKTFRLRSKGFCLQKCLSIYGRWLMCLFLCRKLLLIRSMDHKSQGWGGTRSVNLEPWVTVWLNALSDIRISSITNLDINIPQVSATLEWHFR